MTPKQYENLPNALKEIVDTDRKLGALLCEDVVPIGVAGQVKELTARRRELVAFAAKTWGTAKKNDGNGPGLA